jgi:hypothetical protein
MVCQNFKRLSTQHYGGIRKDGKPKTWQDIMRDIDRLIRDILKTSQQIAEQEIDFAKVQLKGLERVFVDEIEALKSQHFMKPERKQELALKQVTKEEAFEKMKLLLPALTYVGDEEREAPSKLVDNRFESCA